MVETRPVFNEGAEEDLEAQILDVEIPTDRLPRSDKDKIVTTGRVIDYQSDYALMLAAKRNCEMGEEFEEIEEPSTEGMTAEEIEVAAHVKGYFDWREAEIARGSDKTSPTDYERYLRRQQSKAA